MWKNSVDVDELSIADHQKLFPLIEAIYTEALMREVQSTRDKLILNIEF